MATIRSIRESKGLSQGQLAVKADISYGAVSRMERGLPIQKTTLRSVCEALGVSPDDIEGVILLNRVGSTKNG